MNKRASESFDIPGKRKLKKLNLRQRKKFHFYPFVGLAAECKIRFSRRLTKEDKIFDYCDDDPSLSEHDNVLFDWVIPLVEKHYCGCTFSVGGESQTFPEFECLIDVNEEKLPLRRELHAVRGKFERAKHFIDLQTRQLDKLFTDFLSYPFVETVAYIKQDGWNGWGEEEFAIYDKAELRK